MKVTKNAATMSFAVLAAILSVQAAAEDHGWYIGANAGQARDKLDNAAIARSVAGPGFAITSLSENNHDTGYKVFGGYAFSRYFAWEGGYFDLGDFSFTSTTAPAGSLRGNLKVRGFNLDLVGFIPMTDRFSLFGRVGANYAKTSDTFSGTGLVLVPNGNRESKQTNVKYGAGMQYAFNDHVGLRLEAERYRINDAVANKGNIDLISLGLVYRFGGPRPAPVYHTPTPEPVAVAPQPQPVVVAPAPAPVVTPPPPPPRRVKVSFSADSLFDFDKSIEKPEGKASLDKFAADLRGTSYDVITVTGHTDRLGPHDYNVKLSQRRAETVRNYLIEAAGIPPGKINASGANGSDPVTKPEDCVGNKATKKLIACLAPDRRVDVEVTGTR